MNTTIKGDMTNVTSEWAVGNFCLYPRKGVLVAEPIGGWPAGWKRAVSALKLREEDGGVVVETVEGYGPHPRNRVGNRVQVARVLAWLNRHPESAAPARNREWSGDPIKYAEWQMQMYAASIARDLKPRKPWERPATSFRDQDRRDVSVAIRRRMEATRPLPLPWIQRSLLGPIRLPVCAGTD